MFTNQKNFFIALSTAIFVFVGLIAFAVPANGQGTNLITSFINGASYPYDAPNGTKTLTTSGNNINPAIETRGNVGGAISNRISLTAGKQYTLTYTYTLNPTNPAGTAPNIRFVSDTSGRGNIYLASNGVTRILDHTAQSGTKSVVFTPLTTGGYIEVSVGSGSKTNFSMTNISVVLTPPTVTISTNPTSGIVNAVNPQLTWSATNNPTSCAASGDWSGPKAVSGTNVSQGILSTIKTYTYTLTCSNSGGTSLPASATVNVTAPPVPVAVSHSTTFNLTVTAVSRPDLTAGPVSPVTATVNVPQTFTSTISNIGTASTGASFYNFFQKSTSTDGLTFSNVIDILPPVTPVGTPPSTPNKMPALAENNVGNTDQAIATSPSFAFSSAGITNYVRACADKSSAADGGVISEPAPSPLGEFNNCGPWTLVTVTTVPTPVSLPDLIIPGAVTPTSITLSNPSIPTVFHSTIKNQGAVSTQTVSYEFTPTFTKGYLEVSVTNGAKTNFSMSDVRVALNSTSPNLITSFNQGSAYPYNTLTKSGNSITSAIETSGNIGGAVSNELVSLDTSKKYTLTYTLTLNSGIAPDLRLVSGSQGRGNYTSPQNSGLAITAQTGTFPYFFQKAEDVYGRNPTNLNTSPVFLTTTTAVGAGATYDASSPSVSLPAATYYIRACADKSSAAGGGVITESNSAGTGEDNNCGAWTPVTVTAACTAPVITTQPVSQTVTAGSNVTFTTTATGTASLSYQWKKDGNPISGAIYSTYTKNNVQISDAGSYTVTVSNGCGSVPSATATLTVTPIIPSTAKIQMWLNNDEDLSSVRVYLGRTATVNLSQNDKTRYTSCDAYLDVSTPIANQLDIDPTDLWNASPRDLELLLSKDLLTVGTHKFTMSCNKIGASKSVSGVAANGSLELQIQVIDLSFEEN